MKTKRIIGIMLAVCLTGAILSGCGETAETHTGSIMKSNDSSETTQTAAVSETTAATTETTMITTTETTAVSTAETVTEESGTSHTLTDASGDFTYTGELQWIGDDGHGYLQVPANYIPFQDTDAAGLVQYCDGPYNIVTLQKYEGISADTAAENLYYSLSTATDITYDGLTAAEVPIAQYTAKQLYCYVPEMAQYLIIWVISDPADDNACYYLSMEFDADHTDMVACSSTFTPELTEEERK